MPRRKLPDQSRDSAPASFPKRFRTHVTPSLKRLCETQGALLALGIIGFEDAFSIVIRAANDRGALHLPDSIFDDLEGWICGRLVDVAALHDEEIAEARLMADRVAKQCDEYFRAFSAWVAASDDEGSWNWDYPA